MTVVQHEFNCEATVQVFVRNDAPSDWITRVSTEEFPYKHHDGSLLTQLEGFQMLCDNALRNGVGDASRLDGWGDLEPGMVTIEVTSTETWAA